MKKIFTFIKNYWFDVVDTIGMLFIAVCLIVGFGLIENPLWSCLSLFAFFVMLFCWMHKSLLQSDVNCQKRMTEIYKDYSQKLKSLMDSNCARMDDTYKLVENTMHTITDVYEKFSELAKAENKFTSETCKLNAERYHDIIKILTAMAEQQTDKKE